MRIRDQECRVVWGERKIDGETKIAEYTYDALGRRVRKVITNGGLPTDPALSNITVTGSGFKY